MTLWVFYAHDKSIITPQNAPNGYTALSKFDSNADGKIDASDIAFSLLKVWKDLNQDGISQENELFTLAELGIQSLNLAHQESNQDLGNGNRLTHIGSYTKTDGTVGQMGNTALANNPFYSRYTEQIELTLGIEATFKAIFALNLQKAFVDLGEFLAFGHSKYWADGVQFAQYANRTQTITRDV